MSDNTTLSSDRATRPLQAEKSLGELFTELTGDLSHLVHQELELAKVEARQEAKDAGKAAGMFAVAGVGALMTLTFFSFALAWLLDQALNTALSFALVGAVWAAVAAALALRARAQIASVRPIPETVKTLKEDLQWAKTQKS